MPNNTVADRTQRYQLVLNLLLNQDEFVLPELCSQAGEVSPRFVTQVVRELENSGEIQSYSGDTESRYRWRKQRDSFVSHEWIDSRVRGVQITQSPVSERPRERLLANGAQSLKTAELLAILIRTGRPGESAVQAGDRITNRLDGRLDQLPGMSLKELKKYSIAVSEPAYCQIMAGIELGRRVAGAIDECNQRKIKITSSQEAIEYCSRQFARLALDAKQEEFHIVTLDMKNQPTGTHLITIGTLNSSLIHPREVFRPAIRDAAATILLVHNHPSGDPTPSEQDRAATKKLKEAGELLGISVLDHIIVASSHSLSMRNEGMF